MFCQCPENPNPGKYLDLYIYITNSKIRLKDIDVIIFILKLNGQCWLLEDSHIVFLDIFRRIVSAKLTLMIEC